MGLKEILGKGLSYSPSVREEKPRVYRFWLERDSSKEVIFLDDENEVPNAYEHRVLTVGGGVDFVLCMKNFGDVSCPLCESGNKRYFVYYLTVIDVDGYVTRDGRTIRYVKRVMPLKKKAAEALRKQLELWKKRYPNLTLKNLRVVVSRLGLRDAPATGDRFELVKPMTQEEMNELVEKGYVSDLDPVDIEDVVKVFKSVSEFKDYVDRTVIEGSDDEDETEALPPSTESPF